MEGSIEFMKNFEFHQDSFKINKYALFSDILQNQYFGFIVSEQDDFISFGVNEWGQLGNGKSSTSDYVTVDKFKGENIKKIYKGNRCMFALTSSGDLFSWGANDWGQLGRGLELDENGWFEPEKMAFNNESTKIADVKCGSFHIIARSKNGEVFGWGMNHCKQIIEKNESRGDSEIKNIPTLITSDKFDVKIENIFACEDTTFLITQKFNDSKQVYYMGRNSWTSPENFEPDQIVSDEDGYFPPILLNFEADYLIAYNSKIYFIQKRGTKIHLYEFQNEKKNTIVIYDLEREFIVQQNENKFVIVAKLLYEIYDRDITNPSKSEDRALNISENQIYEDLFEILDMISFGNLKLREKIEIKKDFFQENYWEILPFEESLGSTLYSKILNGINKLTKKECAVKKIFFEGI